MIGVFLIFLLCIGVLMVSGHEIVKAVDDNNWINFSLCFIAMFFAIWGIIELLCITFLGHSIFFL